MMPGKKAFQCIRTGKCPQRNGPDGCHVWWKIAMADGGIREGCAWGQDMLFPMIIEAIQQANSAAVSADKATNAACEAMIAANESRNAAAAGMALTLGVVSGEIKASNPQIEQNENVQRRIGPVR